MNYELKDRINGCIAVEHAVASIYETFIKMFPEEENFWEGLYNDEVEHSAFLIDVLNLYSDSGLPEEMQPPSLPFVIKTLEFANNINFRIRSHPVSLEEALKMALKLEETMVETFVNDLIGGLISDSNISSDVDFDKVIISEKEHISRIRNIMLTKGFLRVS